MFLSLRSLISKFSQLPATAVVVGKVVLASVAVTSLVIGLRHLELLEAWELAAYDQSLRLRPQEKPDPRILIVGITESDIQAIKQLPLPDEVLYKALTKLAQYQPSVIGLDIYRDIPVPPGNADIKTLLQQNNSIIPVCKYPESDNPGVPPPPNVPTERVGFSDIPVDNNGIVRRGLLFLEPKFAGNLCPSPYALSFQLATNYLKQKGIEPELTKEEYLKIGNVIFKPLGEKNNLHKLNINGYRNLDARGYQILLNYRSAKDVAQQVSLTEVLAGKIKPEWVRDRIVLIGVTAPSSNDAFYTPYSPSQRRYQKMPGVIIHANLVSEILSSVLDGRPILWFWSEWGEGLWIFAWSLASGALVYVIRQQGLLLLAEIAVLLLLVITSSILFLHAAWVPVIPTILVLVGTSASLIGYNAYQSYQAYKKTILQAQDQEQTLILLQAVLKEKREAPASTELLNNDATAIVSDQEIEDDSITYSRESANFSWLLGNRYKILKVLGLGGFALTYLAEDTQRPGNPQCVVKHLKPARRDEKFLRLARRLFNTEAEILHQLGKHSQIPLLLAYFEENQEFYLVEEYIDGHPLSQYLLPEKRLAEKEVIDLLKNILEVLAFIHDHRVIHRDLKPSNIIRRHEDGHLVLIDFGAVKQIQPQMSENQEGLTIAIGTRGYSAPEQYAGNPKFSSDIYALGMIAIQALTGTFPQQLQPDPQTGNIQWRNLVSVREDLAQIIDKMVLYHFPERYQSAQEVMHDLRRLE